MGANMPMSLIGYYLTSIGCLVIILAAIATTYWGQKAKNNTHFGLFKVCDDEHGCQFYDEASNEGRLCFFSCAAYGVELFLMTFFFAVKRDVEVSTKKYHIQAAFYVIGALLTFIAVGVFAGEKSDLLSDFSYGKSFYLAIASAVIGLICAVFLYMAVDHYVKFNIRRTNSLGISQSNPNFGYVPNQYAGGMTFQPSPIASYPPSTPPPAYGFDKQQLPSGY